MKISIETLSIWALSVCAILLALALVVMAVYAVVIVRQNYFIPANNARKREKYLKQMNEMVKDMETHSELMSQENFEDIEFEISKLKDKIDELTSPELPSIIDAEVIETTERIKDIIDLMISLEVYSVMRRYVSSNKKYEITKIDADISNISTKVYSGLNPDILNTKLVFKNEYLMTYIISQSFNLLLKVSREYNAENIYKL